MGTIKAKLAEWSKNKGLMRASAIIAGVVGILLICLCISICMQTNIHKKYASSIQQMQDQEYQHLAAMADVFVQMNEPEADIRNVLLPELKAHYAAASALNSLLMETAPKRAPLSQDQIAAFDEAFKQYSLAHHLGVATGLAKADMTACMEDVLVMVEERINPPVPEEDKVVIINASSGKIEK